MAGEIMMDGKSLKAFVGNDQGWSRFVDEKFASLNTAHTGTLSHTELEPAIAGVGSALGLPPMGTDPETDHIYTEMFSEFGKGGDGITKQRFSLVMRDMLLGLGDGLEREPVAISMLDGGVLERWAQSAEFEIEAVTAFTNLDSKTTGSVKAGAIPLAMKRLSVEQGMPPQTDASVTGNIDRALQLARVSPQQDLDQTQFVDVYRQVIIAMSRCMREKPMAVAHSEKVFDGSSITNLLKDKATLDLALDLSWEIMPKTSGQSAPKSYLRVGLDTLAPHAGLPPVGAVPEMDDVVNEAFKVIDSDQGSNVDKPGFDKAMLEVLGSIMLQLQGKPIGVRTSGVLPPEKAGAVSTGLPF